MNTDYTTNNDAIATTTNELNKIESVHAQLYKAPVITTEQKQIKEAYDRAYAEESARIKNESLKKNISKARRKGRRKALPVVQQIKEAIVVPTVQAVQTVANTAMPIVQAGGNLAGGIIHQMQPEVIVVTGRGKNKKVAVVKKNPVVRGQIEIRDINGFVRVKPTLGGGEKGGPLHRIHTLGKREVAFGGDCKPTFVNQRTNQSMFGEKRSVVFASRGSPFGTKPTIMVDDTKRMTLGVPWK